MCIISAAIIFTIIFASNFKEDSTIDFAITKFPRNNRIEDITRSVNTLSRFLFSSQKHLSISVTSR